MPSASMNPLTFEMLALSSISAYSPFASLDRSARLSSIRNRGKGTYDAERLSVVNRKIFCFIVTSILSIKKTVLIGLMDDSIERSFISY